MEENTENWLQEQRWKWSHSMNMLQEVTFQVLVSVCEIVLHEFVRFRI